MSFEHDELDGKYSLISCRTTCVLLCMTLSCLAQALECCLHCMSLSVIGQGMPVFKCMVSGKQVVTLGDILWWQASLFFLPLKQEVKVGNLFI